MLIEQLTSLDQLDITLNGAQLELAKARQRLNYNDCWLDFEVPANLKQGNNSLRVTLKERNEHILVAFDHPQRRSTGVLHRSGK